MFVIEIVNKNKIRIIRIRKFEYIMTNETDYTEFVLKTHEQRYL